MIDNAQPFAPLLLLLPQLLHTNGIVLLLLLNMHALAGAPEGRPPLFPMTSALLLMPQEVATLSPQPCRSCRTDRPHTSTPAHQHTTAALAAVLQEV